MSELTEVAAALTADLIVDGSQAGDPVISPDGRWVVWSTFRAGGKDWSASCGSPPSGRARFRSG